MKKQTYKQKYFKYISKLQHRLKEITSGKVKLIAWGEIKKKYGID